MCAALLALFLIQQGKDSKLVCDLLKRMDTLQQDNKALTEALVRSEGKPLIFRKSEPIQGEGWFDRVNTDVHIG
jgi:hypothetical protein